MVRKSPCRILKKPHTDSHRLLPFPAVTQTNSGRLCFLFLPCRRQWFYPSLKPSVPNHEGIYISYHLPPLPISINRALCYLNYALIRQTSNLLPKRSFFLPHLGNTKQISVHPNRKTQLHLCPKSLKPFDLAVFLGKQDNRLDMSCVGKHIIKMHCMSMITYLFKILNISYLCCWIT